MDTSVKTLKVAAISEVKQDKNQNNFRTFTLETGDGAELQTGLDGRPRIVAVPTETVGGVNLYEKSYLPSNNGKPDFGYTSALGTHLRGFIVRRQVEPYTIPANGNSPARTVNTYRTAILGVDSTDFAAVTRAIAATFKSRGHEVITDWSDEERAILEVAQQPAAADAPAPTVAENAVA